MRALAGRVEQLCEVLYVDIRACSGCTVIAVNARQQRDFSSVSLGRLLTVMFGQTQTGQMLRTGQTSIRACSGFNHTRWFSRSSIMHKSGMVQMPFFNPAP